MKEKKREPYVREMMRDWTPKLRVKVVLARVDLKEQFSVGEDQILEQREERGIEREDVDAWALFTHIPQRRFVYPISRPNPSNLIYSFFAWWGQGGGGLDKRQ